MKAALPQASEQRPQSPSAFPSATQQSIEVPVLDNGGTVSVPVTINGKISLEFILDSGASDVSIPSDVVSTLIRTGTIDSSDFIGTQTFTLADGSTVPSTEFRIRSLTVGALTLHNVTASLADAKAPLLLGQSFLRRLSSWSIDNSKPALILSVDGKAQALAPELATAPHETSPVESNDTTTVSQVGMGNGEGGEAALARTMEYFATSSSAPDSSALGEYYGPYVKYFGVSKPREEVLRDKQQFMSRWPIRSYIPRTVSSHVACTTATHCTVTGVLDWQDENRLTGVTSAGAASFSLTLEQGKIVAETSHVLSREPAGEPAS